MIQATPKILFLLFLSGSGFVLQFGTWKNEKKDILSKRCSPFFPLNLRLRRRFRLLRVGNLPSIMADQPFGAESGDGDHGEHPEDDESDLTSW